VLKNRTLQVGLSNGSSREGDMERGIDGMSYMGKGIGIL